MDFHATLCKGQQQQGAAEEQERICLAESTAEQAPSVSQLAASDILLFVEGQRHQPHQWNLQLYCQPPQPATPAPAAYLTLTKDVQYSLAPEERIIHEVLKPTRPI
jgi:hypothetical protein